MTPRPVYPIGRLALPAEPDADALAHAVDRIAALPAALRAALDGCTDLDRPIRPGAWSLRALAHHVADSHLNAFVRTKLALTEPAPTVRPYDEVAWSRTPDAALPVAPSLALLEGLHERWAHLLRSLGPVEFDRPWCHPDAAGPQPLWHLPLTYAWHGDHHVAQIVAARAGEGV
jgi:hypothetical protein